MQSQPEEIDADPRESRFVLPPVERAPFADRGERARAVRRMLEQAERERAEPRDSPPPGDAG
jgi:hypothetical protein